eukprot:scaffold133_cov115-Cylindrotheca_fusiformis.AAC.1
MNGHKKEEEGGRGCMAIWNRCCHCIRNYFKKVTSQESKGRNTAIRGRKRRVVAAARSHSYDGGVGMGCGIFGGGGGGMIGPLPLAFFFDVLADLDMGDLLESLVPLVDFKVRDLVDFV